MLIPHCPGHLDYRRPNEQAELLSGKLHVFLSKDNLRRSCIHFFIHSTNFQRIDMCAGLRQEHIKAFMEPCILVNHLSHPKKGPCQLRQRTVV